MRDVGERFIKMRKNLGMTQKEFSNYLGISTGSVQAYEAGKIPKGEIFQRLSQLGYDLNWLFSGTGELTQKPAKNYSPSAVEPESMLIWNVAYYMFKNTNPDMKPEDFAKEFMEQLDQLNRARALKAEEEITEDEDSNVICFPMARAR